MAPYVMSRTIQGIQESDRVDLGHGLGHLEIGKNLAALVKVPKPRRRRVKPWSAVEAGAVPRGRGDS